MKTRNISVYLIIVLFLMLNFIKNSDYMDLEKTSDKSIKLKDLPKEFSKKSLDLVNDFIQKTHLLDFEVVMFFDYVTGEIIDYAMGKGDSVEIEINWDDFKGKHVASIHNHPKNVLSPPSGKNFRILKRNLRILNLLWDLKIFGFWKLKASMSVLLMK